MKVPWWCMGKTRYETKAEAMYRVKRQCKDCHRGRKKGWAGSQIMTSYKCSTCGYWHVGGTSKSAVQRSDKNGHIIRKKRNGHGGPKGTEQGGQAPVPSLHTDPQEQAGQVTERQPQS